MKKFIDLTNKKFGKWTVIERGSLDTDGHIKWICECECGIRKEVNRSSLRNGRSKGCQKCCKTNFKHGFSRSDTYKVWDAMIQRCENPMSPNYILYGIRGIKVCDRWKESFLNFLEDMGERPKKLTLDRIDNDKGYFKENCRWTTMSVQNRNRRDSVKVGYFYHGWELIHRYSDPCKSRFRCIYCGVLIDYNTSLVKTGHKICNCRK